ncbi:unnamed protein product [Vitrella brassicaformis CCMP3155]|uniref:J domain-containing protein n=1 Tax=Vitrella brassicaformis (strain CCMP3155) TaxID=1169540 RepID=A0A0G4FPZ3_VITBC|nr:unnamed protein product [Vitrella brassicaformis CCMP3155]|eukprot:CEM15861.1 unnamed protein product [Vitrella brassicaformis CCMP3155]
MLRRLRRACKILGVSEWDNKALVRRAYKEKALQHHPDKGGTKEGFQRLKRAYELVHAAAPEPPKSCEEGEATGACLDRLGGLCPKCAKMYQAKALREMTWEAEAKAPVAEEEAHAATTPAATVSSHPSFHTDQGPPVTSRGEGLWSRWFPDFFCTCCGFPRGRPQCIAAFILYLWTFSFHFSVADSLQQGMRQVRKRRQVDYCREHRVDLLRRRILPYGAQQHRGSWDGVRVDHCLVLQTRRGVFLPTTAPSFWVHLAMMVFYGLGLFVATIWAFMFEPTIHWEGAPGMYAESYELAPALAPKPVMATTMS